MGFDRHPHRAAHPAARRLYAAPLLLAALAGCAEPPPADRALPPGVVGKLVASVHDTLESRAGYAVGKPIWISLDAAGRYVVADESDKSLKLFDRLGRETGSVGRPGSGPGEFTSLLGGGALGDSLYGYDFSGTRLTVFTPAGKYGRSVSIASPGQPMPSAVRVVDDSLVLVAGFPAGSHRGELVRLVRRDGTERSAFLNLARYFDPESPPLLQSSVVYADGADGTVFAVLMGHDSVYAFDYDGKRLGAGPLALEDGSRIRTFRSLIEGNGGSRTLPGGRVVTEGHPAVVAVAALGRDHAVLQLMTLDYGGQGRLDRTAGGTFILASLDRARGTVSLSGYEEREGGLQGRTGGGAALLARYVGEEFDRIELSRLQVEDTKGGTR